MLAVCMSNMSVSVYMQVEIERGDKKAEVKDRSEGGVD